ncbi:MAG: hypothetical protein NT069_22060 [Planctomycetota bacterium]|nr:hypothetical protein [Planctomycetota bacterium]
MKAKAQSIRPSIASFSHVTAAFCTILAWSLMVAGCGPSAAERMKAYQTAGEILKTEKAKLAAQEKTLKDLRDTVADPHIENEVKRRKKEAGISENFPNTNIEELNDWEKSEREIRASVFRDLRTPGTAISKLVEEQFANDFGTLIDESKQQASRVERAEKMLADAEKNLPK